MYSFFGMEEQNFDKVNITRVSYKDVENENNENEYENEEDNINNTSFYETNDVPEKKVREYYFQQYSKYFFRALHVNERYT
jgi:hypothetical protein